jgi:pSer/pThr/pTyr-binding forkhead associated (FHA) protein
MDVRLEVVHENSRVRNVRLRRNTIVGRGKDCQLRIPLADVSRQHCQFTLKDEQLFVRDLGSSNGTQIAERTIPTGKDILLADGDTVTVGPVSFVIHVTAEEAQLDDSRTQPEDLDDTAEFQLEENPDRNALDEDLSPDSDEDSVVELQLFQPSADGVDPELNEPAEPEPEQPLKSRSLFGLFRRRSTPAQSTAELEDDDLMEEPGEDPPGLVDDPSEVEDPDDIATHEHYDGDIAAADDPSDKSATVPSEEKDTSESVFDDDDSAPFDFLESDGDSDKPADDNLGDFLGQFGD